MYLQGPVGEPVANMGISWYLTGDLMGRNGDVPWALLGFHGGNAGKIADG